MNYTQLQFEPRLPLFSVALISATVLAYEILLTRLFSIVQWHHFAYMVISIALLGFAASGTFLALKAHLVERFNQVYVTNLILFSVFALPCILLAQQFAVHPEQLLWDPIQMVRVSAVYILLALPFFFAANAIGLALMRFRQNVTKIYAADLIGAGLGSIIIVGLLYVLFPMNALIVLCVFGLVAAMIAGYELSFNRNSFGIIVIIASSLLIIFNILPVTWLKLSISPYKSLSQQLNVKGAYIETERSTPLGMLSVIASPTIPLRHAPGLSLNTTVEVPDQRGVFIDGDSITPINEHTEHKDSAYLDNLTSALPYHLNRLEHVVVLGAGGGSLVRQALHHGISSITAVELDHKIIKLLREEYRDFSGRIYDHKSVNVQIKEARGFLEGNPKRYDLIQIALIDSFAASSAGLYALNENYLYTVEALDEFYSHLSKGGYLSISRWVKLPPRDALKLFATAIESLRRAGIADPAKQLLLIRGWQTTTLLIKNGSFSKQEIDNAKQFCKSRSFDLAFYANMPVSLANQYNMLPKAYYYYGAKALLSETPEQFLVNYKFNIRPATDDRPYFFYFFKWRTLPEIFSLRGRGGTPLLESGYVILFATLIQAVLFSFVLIVLPLWKRMRAGNVRHWNMVGYFASLGFAFFFIEIAFIQKFILFLHHPVLAVAAVLSGFLVFAGFGSFLAQRWQTGQQAHRLVIIAVIIIGVLGLLYALVLPDLVFEPLIAAPMLVKLVVSLFLIGLLAIPMGIPFPLGLARLGEQAKKHIPSAWAINGCASVISAVLATVIAIHFGFTVVVLIAVMLYLLAAGLFKF